MFKKALLMASAIVLSFSVSAARFTAGEDYQVLELPKSEQPSITEFFSFYCPYCYRSQGLMNSLKKNIPNNTPFTKNHVSFMGGNMGKALSKTYAALIMLEADEKLMPVIFERVQNSKNPPRTEEELHQIVIDEGVDAKKFDSAYKSFAGSAMANRFDKSFQASGLKGVPALIVNGKYHVTPKTLKSQDDYLELVNYLLTK